MRKHSTHLRKLIEVISPARRFRGTRATLRNACHGTFSTALLTSVRTHSPECRFCRFAATTGARSLCVPPHWSSLLSSCEGCMQPSAEASPAAAHRGYTLGSRPQAWDVTPARCTLRRLGGSGHSVQWRGQGGLSQGRMQPGSLKKCVAACHAII